MKACIGCGKEDPTISERVSVRHDCVTPDGRLPIGKGAVAPVTTVWAPPPLVPRPPRAAGSIVCRGCFNRCILTPGKPGICTVKRNIAGRITGSSLRVKGIVSGS